MSCSLLPLGEGLGMRVYRSNLFLIPTVRNGIQRQSDQMDQSERIASLTPVQADSGLRRLAAPQCGEACLTDNPMKLFERATPRVGGVASTVPKRNLNGKARAYRTGERQSRMNVDALCPSRSSMRANNSLKPHTAMSETMDRRDGHLSAHAGHLSHSSVPRGEFESSDIALDAAKALVDAD
jgi:hypothetical protein